MRPSHSLSCPYAPVQLVVPTRPPSLPIPLGLSSGSFGATLDLDYVDAFGVAVNIHPAFVTAAGSLNQAINNFVAGLNSGRVYLNIHSSTFPGGEIRSDMPPLPTSACAADMTA